MNGRKLSRDARGVRWKARDKKEVNNFYGTVLNEIMFNFKGRRDIKANEGRIIGTRAASDEFWGIRRGTITFCGMFVKGS